MQDLFYPVWCYVLIALFCIIPLVLILGVFIIYAVRSRHMLFEMCHNSWKRMWYWCRKQEEYELQDFTEVQRCYQTGEQILLDRIDANFPELLSFDNIQGPVTTNGHIHTLTGDGNYRTMPRNSNVDHSKSTRHLSIWEPWLHKCLTRFCRGCRARLTRAHRVYFARRPARFNLKPPKKIPRICNRFPCGRINHNLHLSYACVCITMCAFCAQLAARHFVRVMTYETYQTGFQSPTWRTKMIKCTEIIQWF